MKNVLIFLQGKKTYISAAALALVAVGGWWYGAVDTTTALAMLSAAGISAGLGAKSERYGQLVLAALSNVRDAQAQHKPIDVKALGGEVVKQLAETAVAIGGTGTPAPGSIRLSVPANSTAQPDAFVIPMPGVTVK